MTKYPPITTDSSESITAKEIKVPYLRLYHEAVRKNPTMGEERVYPAYWQQEPLAMTLAKKQYALMQTGLSEDEAYIKAKEVVDSLESSAYDSLKALKEKIGEESDSRPAVLADKEVAEEVASWRTKLSETPYDELDLADQGELDYFVQRKVLGWSEVERERRMTDPVFVFQFEMLRRSMFDSESEDDLMDDSFKEKLQDYFGVSDTSQLRAREPFFYEDYKRWFDKLKDQPNFKSWDKEERGNMSRWIVQTLGMQQVIENNDRTEVRAYFERLRLQFFPMINSPGAVDKYSLPSVEEAKELLYANDIGYRRQGEDGKLFVKRFYRIPRLLFPEHILETTVRNDENRLRRALSTQESLLEEIKAVGLDESRLPDIKAALQRYATESNVTTDTVGEEISVLDQLLSDGDKAIVRPDESLADRDFSHSGTQQQQSTSSSTEASSQESYTPAQHFTFADELLPETYARNYEEPSNDYEKDLDMILRGSEVVSLEEVSDEIDMYSFNETRAENLLVIRTRLETAYEEKEAARRGRKWQAQGKWNGDEIENSELLGLE